MRDRSDLAGGAARCERRSNSGWRLLVTALTLGLWACGNTTTGNLTTTTTPPGVDALPPVIIDPAEGGAEEDPEVEITHPGTTWPEPEEPAEPPPPAEEDSGGGTVVVEEPPPPAGPVTDEGSTPETKLPDCTTGVIAAFDLNALKPPDMNTNAYRLPTEARRTALRGSLDAFLEGDLSAALLLATNARYTLCRGTGAEADLVLWRPPAGEGQALIALRTTGARPALLEVPHPIFDGDMIGEAVVVFQRLKARALIASTTHRCANTSKSTCTGTTDACGSLTAFRVSDMAHTETSLFHTAHVALAEGFATDLVVQLHGMTGSGVSVSNGTLLATTPTTPSARLALALAKSFSGITTCNTFKGVTYSSRLCGTTTTQGRHVNGVATNACTTSAKQASGRFVHLEQSLTVRSQPERVADALGTILP